MTLRRLVLDTNVVVSALLFPTRRLAWLRNAWQSQAVVPLASRETTAELSRVLASPKFQLTAAKRKNLLTASLSWCEPVRVSAPPAVPPCRDPSDRPFLELALVGHADALGTGDRDLLAVAPLFSVPILTPAELQGRVSS